LLAAISNILLFLDDIETIPLDDFSTFAQFGKVIDSILSLPLLIV
jgi:hypothetical protein